MGCVMGVDCGVTWDGVCDGGWTVVTGGGVCDWGWTVR